MARRPVDEPIFAPATIAVLGGGQLGSMLCEAGRRMGYRMVVLSERADDPAGRWADEHVVADPNDAGPVATLAERVDVLTVETENIPAEVLEAAAATGCRVAPGSAVQATARDRRSEKTFFKDGGFGVGPFAIANSAAEMRPALERLFKTHDSGLKTPPAVVAKTARGGYDGKGQRWIRSADEANVAWGALGGVPLMLEMGVAFVAEASVIVARAANGQCVSLPVFRNEHRNGILFQTQSPGGFSDQTVGAARAMAEGIAGKLGAVGLIAVEMFVLADGRVWANEMAARPHNSGHLSLRACTRSQFELHLQAICGLPLQPAELLKPAVMTNLLGDLWARGEPRWEHVFADPTATLHLYGKSPRPGRKMGHMIQTGVTAEEVAERAGRLFSRLMPEKTDSPASI